MEKINIETEVLYFEMNAGTIDKDDMSRIVKILGDTSKYADKYYQAFMECYKFGAESVDDNVDMNQLINRRALELIFSIDPDFVLYSDIYVHYVGVDENPNSLVVHLSDEMFTSISLELIYDKDTGCIKYIKLYCMHRSNNKEDEKTLNRMKSIGWTYTGRGFDYF